jgi:hypothetical protein
LNNCSQTHQKRCDKFYDLPSTINKRASAIGYGIKSQMTNKLNLLVPGPTKYNHTSAFDSGRKSRGYSFGLGREVIFLFISDMILSITKQKIFFPS